LLFTSGENLPKKNILKIPHLDKAVHFFLFLGLEFLLSIEFGAKKRIIPLKSILLIATVPIIYAALTELIQLFFIYDRDGAWLDFIADILGIIIGFVFYMFFRKRTTNLL
jgi:VanZ family protein